MDLEREAAARLVLLAAAVGLGVGLLLTALSGINAINSQNARYAWLDTAAAHQKPNGRGPLWGMVTADGFDGQAITRVDVAVITTIDAERGAPPPGQTAGATLLDRFTGEKVGVPPAPSAGMLAALNATSGVRGTAVIHLDTPGITIPSTLIGKPAGWCRRRPRTTSSPEPG